MVLSLDKGANVSLEKIEPGLTKVTVALRWDARSTDGAPFDLDASALMLGEDEKVRSVADFIFYNQKSSPEGAVVYNGDNRTGEGDGDDETISVDLSKVPGDVKKIVISVSIDKAGERNQNFGQVRNAVCRLDNAETNAQLVQFDLTEDHGTETAMNFAELYRAADGGWKFKGVGQGYADGLAGIARDFGVPLG